MKKVFLFFFIGMLSVVAQENNRGYIVNVGEKAPIINILEEYKNHVIMLKFTASWCSVCMKEMPFIEQEIWQQHQTNNEFILIALAKDTEKRPQAEEQIQFMIDRTGVSYPIVRDVHSEIFHLFAEKNAGVTRNIIIDQNGKIAFLTRLFERSEFDEMKSTINALLSK